MARLGARRLPGAGALGRSCAAASTSDRGWSRTTSRSSRPCRRWSPCGRPSRWTRVRLLIMGGEACPPEIGARLARPGRELWNTYGPTEATVVACGAQLTADGSGAHRPAPGRLGPRRRRRARHARAARRGRRADHRRRRAGPLPRSRKDAEKYAPFPTLGWERAYRSGDRVVYDEQGLVFAGRGDDQVKLGGRRIELGEIDNALLALPGVLSAAAAVRTSRAGNQLLVGYVTTERRLRREPPRSSTSGRSCPPPSCRGSPRWRRCRRRRPARSTGTRCRGRSPPTETGEHAAAELHGTAAWVAELWLDVVGRGRHRRGSTTSSTSAAAA